ncbi:MAG: hypothetical protein P1P84_02520 [Deferrisomatales bacterium]|nr:hypothetical protein [Deferrisomatales bacterium]
MDDNESRGYWRRKNTDALVRATWAIVFVTGAVALLVANRILGG